MDSFSLSVFSSTDFYRKDIFTPAKPSSFRTLTQPRRSRGASAELFRHTRLCLSAALPAFADITLSALSNSHYSVDLQYPFAI